MEDGRAEAYDRGYKQGAEVDRERIAIRQDEAHECPPEYMGKNCDEMENNCKKCWLDWLEAAE